MSYQIEIRPGAHQDIADAATWYEEREQGLGDRFIREVVAAVDALPGNPLIYRVRHKRTGARWCFPEHFPHRIVFSVVGDWIRIVAVTHAKRHDRNWRGRM